LRIQISHEMQTIVRTFGIAVAILVISVIGAVPAARAQGIGGHIGVVFPLVTHAEGQTTSLADNFAFGIPFGVTFKGKGPMALDFEFVPAVQDSPRKISLTVHPGVVYGIGHGFGVGIRAAFDVNTSQVGFTPLVNKSWAIKREGSFFKAYFVEADLPVRFNRPPGGPRANPVTFAMHFGLGF